MRNRRKLLFWVILLLLGTGTRIYGAGISVDAGLTPPEDRWIFRSLMRYTTRRDDPTGMGRHTSMYEWPAVVAYGMTSDFSMMLRYSLLHRDMDMMGGVNDKDTGTGDLFAMGKYKLFRQNTPDYTVGLAGTLGFEFPVGRGSFSSETYDIMPGLYGSFRREAFAADMQIAYKWNGFADRGEDGLNPGNMFRIDCAAAYQFDLDEDASTTIAPVLELSYINVAPDRKHDRNLANTGENVIYLSPGFKYTQENFIFEALLQIPVWQDQKGTLLERGVAFIVGTRIMF